MSGCFRFIEARDDGLDVFVGLVVGHHDQAARLQVARDRRIADHGRVVILTAGRATAAPATTTAGASGSRGTGRGRRGASWRLRGAGLGQKIGSEEQRNSDREPRANGKTRWIHRNALEGKCATE